MDARRFYLDTTARSFVGSPDSTLPSLSGAFFSEDVEQVELYFLKRGGNAAQALEYLDYSSNAVKLAVGVTAPAALVTSFSALSTTVAITASVSITGGAGINEVQRIQIAPRPATGSFAVQLPARNVTVSSITSSVFTAVRHGLLDGQSVTLTAFTITSGFGNGQQVFIRDRTRDTFKVAGAQGGTALTVEASGGTAEVDAITTAALPANASPGDVQSALVSAGVAVNNQAQIAVTGSENDYLLTYAGTLAGIDLPTVAVVGSTLSAAPGLSALLSFNTNEVAALVAAGQGGNCTLEVEVFNGDTTARQTYQQRATIDDDIITSTSPIPAPVGDTVSSLNFDDGSGGTWTVTVDANGVLTATKQ
jgi:hypothetical protein